ncbi:MAG: universal stress protein [Candidatus Eremiobacteraeota bacterium]|nr:universal stress protein [Candidatus Eremiobacteraeota bacterium]
MPVDGSEISLNALDVAADFAQTLKSKLVVCHVVDVARAAAMTYGESQFVGGCLEALRDEGRSIVQIAADRLRPLAQGAETRLLEGAPVEQILKIVEELHAAWIVMGSHGRSGLSRALLGSVAEDVVRHAHVPVTIVPMRAHAQLPREASPKVAI